MVFGTEEIGDEKKFQKNLEVRKSRLPLHSQNGNGVGSEEKKRCREVEMSRDCKRETVL